MSNKPKTLAKKTLAKIVGDVSDITTFIANDEYLAVVNQEPPKSLIKDHPTAKGVKYMPIEIVEALLTKVYQDWYVEVVETGILANSAHTTVRLFFKHPVTREWLHHDGVGAVALQTDKGSKAADLNSIKSNAVMLALPASKSFAIKDAAEHLGKLFGRDLNRTEALAFDPAYATEEGLDLRKEKLKEKLDADT